MHNLFVNFNVYLIPPVLFLITGIGLALIPLLKGKRQYENVLFAIVCIFYTMIMPVFISHHIFKGNIALIMKMERGVHFFYVYTPAFIILLFHSILNKKNRLIETGSFVISFLISLTVFTDYYMYGLWEYRWGYIAKGGIFLQLFGVWALAAIIYSLIISLKKLSTDIDDYNKLKIRYLMFGIISIGVLTIGNLPAINGIDIYPAGNFAFIPMMILGWGIYRFDVIKINLYTKRRITGTAARIFLAAMLIAAVPVCLEGIRNYSLSHIAERTIKYGIPPLFSLICSSFLSFLSLRIGENRKSSILFSLLMLAYAYSCLDNYLNCIITDPVTGLMVSRFSRLLVVFIPALGMHLIRSITKRETEKKLLYATYLICFIFFLFSQSDYYIKGMHVYSWGLFPEKAFMFDLMSVLVVLTLIYNITILLKAYRLGSDRFYQNRFYLFLFGTATIILMTLGNIPVMNSFDIYPPGNFIFVPSTFFAIALFRNNILELIRIVGLFLYYQIMLVTIFTFVYLLSLKHTDRFFPLYIFLAILITVLIDHFLIKLRDTVIGRQSNKLKFAFENLTDKLSRAKNISDIYNCITGCCFVSLFCSECSILVFDERTGLYTGRKIQNNNSGQMNFLTETDDLTSIMINPDHPLIKFINQKHSIVNIEEIEYLIINNELSLDIEDPFRKGELVLPVFFENRLSAVIIFGVKSDGSNYSKKEMEFLYQLGINLGPHIENTRILQRLEETLDERTQNLRNSEKKYRHFIENANEIIYKADWLGNFIYSNPACQRIIEYTSDELSRLNYIDIIPPEYRDLEFAYYSEQLKSGIDETQHELPLITKSGKIIWVEQFVKSIKDDTGRIIEFDCIVHDITERKAAENALRESEKKYRHFIENSNEIIYKADWKGNFIYTNPACQRLVEYTYEEISHLNYLDLIPPANRESEFAFYSEQLKSKIDETHRELPLLTKSGKILWAEQHVRSVKDDTGRIIEFDSIVHDITDRKAAEDALREREKRYQKLMENVNDCVFICQLDGHLKYVNQAITRLTGRSHNDLIGTHFLSMVHPEYRNQLLAFYQNQVIKNIEFTYREFPVLYKKDEIKWVGQSVRMIRNTDGEMEFYGITRDISMLKKAAEARRDLEEAKTRFFANISHEIRTPLTLMLGPIESVLQGDYGKEIGTDFFKNLHKNTLRLLKLVNNILDFSKIEAGKMTLRVIEGDIVHFARNYLSTIKLAGKTKNINLSFESPDDPVMMYFDPEKLDKVFMNLLSNALKFTESGGSISIKITNDKNRCRVIISDTGEGIPEDSLDSIFDRFSQADSTSTRKYEGTGIGLALVKELVELHGGIIEVDSRHIDEYPDNHGSVFILAFPKGMAHLEKRSDVTFAEKTNLDDYIKDYRLIGLKEIEESKLADNSSVSPEIEDQQFSSNKKTVLVVDDNEDMRNFLKILLQKYYNVIFADNGKNGIVAARNSKPDLIVTDVMMPVMNGIDMTSIIKNDDVLKTIPVIMLTADTELMNKVSGLENGADDYLHKPFNTMELITRISSLMKNYEYQQIISRRNADIERELEVARLLQERLLPQSMPEISGYHGHAVYIPMDKIGGDFYDFENRDGFINLFIADVSGHGLPGAFLATVTKIALENITNRTSSSKVLYQLNNVILHHTVQSNFVTAFFAIIDISTNVMKYACAGHVAPVLYRRKEERFIELKTKGSPLGWFNDIKIEEKTIQLDSGDRLLLYTDGITECINTRNEMFGEERLCKTLKEYSMMPAEKFTEELMKELEIYNNNSNFDDDITMVVLDVL